MPVEEVANSQSVANGQSVADVRRIAPELYNTYKYESNRLRTFRQWPESVANISGKQLASAGLYYTGQQTTVQCFECGANISHWSPAEDTPIGNKHYNNCAFIHGFSDNIPLVDGTGSTESVQSLNNCHNNHNNNISNNSINSPVNGFPASDDSGNSSDSSPLSSSPPDMTSASGNSSPESDGESEESIENNIIYNRIQNMVEFRRLMKSEQNRLKTFHINGQSVWPVPGVSVQDLARAGFYYVQDDQVQCAFCTGFIKNWNSGLRPLEEHSKHFPLCPFVMEEDVGNIPIDTDPVRDPLSVVGHDVCGSRMPSPSEQIGGQVVNTRDRNSPNSDQQQQQPIDVQSLGIQLYSGPKHPEMGPLENRKSSFRINGWDDTVPVSADRLAEAGFYYIGSRDAVICFHCNGGLCDWAPGDDPWVEHAKNFGNCNFLKLNKSQTFIDECKRLDQLSRDDNKHTNSDDITACLIVNDWMSTDLVQQLIQMKTFSIDLIKATLNSRYYSCKMPFESFAQLYNAVNELAVNRPIGMSSEHRLNVRQSDNPSILISANNDQSEPTTQQSNSEQTSHNSSPSMSSTSTTSTSIAPEPAQQASGSSPKLSDNRTTDNSSTSEIRLVCKICYLSEIEVVFLPCGHQLACSQCAQRLTDCPVCRQEIRGFVRTFFS